MRHPEEKIKEAVLHPDLDVRDTAIRYFYSSTSPDDTLMPLAIQAIERVRPDESLLVHPLPQPPAADRSDHRLGRRRVAG